MIDVGAAAAGLAGAWRLARLDRSGMRYFEATPEAFWRSFQAAIIAAPIYVVLVLLRSDDHPLSPDPVRAALIETIGYVIQWTAFPLAAWYLTRAFNVSGRYFGFMVAYNWASVLQVLASLPIVLISMSGLLPGGLVDIVYLLFLAGVFYYQYFIARIALAVDAVQAIAFVATDVVLSYVLDRVQTFMHMQ